MAMVKLAGVGRRYGSVAPVVALRAIDLEVRPGESVAIVGPSGSGKSTLLNIIGCLDRPTSGSYWLNGVDVASLSDRQRAGLRSRHLGFVFQSFHLLAYRSVLENVMLAEVYGRRPRVGRADRAGAALTTASDLAVGNLTPSLGPDVRGRVRVEVSGRLIAKQQLRSIDERPGAGRPPSTSITLRTPESVIVETDVGAAALLSRQIAVALSPQDPTGLKIVSPEQPQQLRAGVRSDLEMLFLVLGAVSLLVGAIGIANVTLVSAMERVGEIGLRRSLGATRRHIAAQFLLESATMGVLGGVLGACAGLVVVAVAAYQTWTR